MSETNYTAAQQEALEKAYDLLGEHFDQSVIAVNAEVIQGGNSADCGRIFWSGGYFAALGLALTALKGISATECKSEVKPSE